MNDKVELFEDYETAVEYMLVYGGKLFSISHYYKLLDEEILIFVDK